ncbi:MAG TPA: hypothetical protein ENI48_01105 [Thioploca sp.]|nr:hypothetical protein [Thioploca sp.]
MDAKPEPLAEVQEMGQSQSGLQKTSIDAEPQPGPQQDSNVLTDDKEMALSSARAEQPKASVALRVGMYCLTVLNQLMQLPQPNEVLSVPKVQDALRDNLGYFAQRHPQAYFLVIVDGANQAPDPGGLLGGLPDPLPSNIYILVSSQPQQRVRQPLTVYGHQQWAFTDIEQLAPAEAEAVVWHYWTVDLAGQPSCRPVCCSAFAKPVRMCRFSWRIGRSGYGSIGRIINQRLRPRERLILNNIMRRRCRCFCEIGWKKLSGRLSQHCYWRRCCGVLV